MNDFPGFLWHTLRQGLRWLAWRLVQRPRPPRNADDRVLLHLGCGRIDAPGFINVDAIPRKHVHHVLSLANLGPFADGSVDFVYVSHALEHFSHAVVPRVLREWYRVLKPGGRLCLSVPDFDKLLHIYEDNGQDISAIQNALMGGQDYAYNFHYVAFTERYLTRLLREAGFAAVGPWQHGSDALHSMNDWSGRLYQLNGKAYPISLNLEATK